MSVEFLSLEDLLSLIDDLGVGPVKDVGLLGTAAHRPQTSVWGQDAYPSVDEKAAALMESLTRNHPLVDGNKRLAWLAVVVFYGLNGVTLDAPDDPAYDLVVAVATGEIGYPESAALLRSWARPNP